MNRIEMKTLQLLLRKAVKSNCFTIDEKTSIVEVFKAIGSTLYDPGR